VQAGESHERKNSDLFGGREEFWQRRERSEGEEKITRAHIPRNGDAEQSTPTGHERAEDREDLEDRAGNGQRSGRRRERRNDPLPQSSAEANAVPHRYGHFKTL